MKQKSLTDGFEKFRKQTHKEQFLAEMENIIPWKELTGAIKPSRPNKHWKNSSPSCHDNRISCR